MRVFEFYIFMFVFLIPSVSFASAAEGKKIFIEKNCTECHEIDASKKDTFGKGPDLWYAGSKFKPGFLKEWLTKPLSIRPMAYNSIKEGNPGNHPKLSKEDAVAVTEFLMTLIIPQVKEGLIKPNKSPKARSFFERRFGCYGCHLVRKGDFTIGGLSGPILIGLDKRLKPDWIYAYLKTTKFFAPSSSRMPVFTGIINDGEMMELAGYVSSLE